LKRLLLTYPAMTAGVAQAAVALAITLGFRLTPVEAGAIESAAAAVAALWTGLRARPFEPALLTGALTAIGTLLVAYKVPHVSAAVVSAANAFLAAVLAGLLHGNVTPTVHLPKAPQPEGEHSAF
jgi:hypothetical protein